MAKIGYSIQVYGEPMIIRQYCIAGIFRGANFHGFHGLEANHENVTHEILKYSQLP